ncbi:hypothetical protein RRG08_050814 [Elysia crispata]|uniref:Uncharacterized protein n=1 Tax=Elysia crispata TaxID=231223 RepID=A0AAE1ADX5_9GAST|nr:hypothetical protein RRG08_050814 [Elysia crispata]
MRRTEVFDYRALEAFTAQPTHGSVGPNKSDLTTTDQVLTHVQLDNQPDQTKGRQTLKPLKFVHRCPEQCHCLAKMLLVVLIAFARAHFAVTNTHQAGSKRHCCIRQANSLDRLRLVILGKGPMAATDEVLMRVYLLLRMLK